MQKQCFKCQQVLPVKEFYRHPAMRDGHLNKCKDCTRKDVSRNYRTNREYFQEYDALREKDPKRRRKKSSYQKRYRERNPGKVRARRKLRRAVRSGELEPQPCRRCGSLEVEAHHGDYLRPLDIEWLCFRCHRKRHGQLSGVRA